MVRGAEKGRKKEYQKTRFKTKADAAKNTKSLLKKKIQGSVLTAEIRQKRRETTLFSARNTKKKELQIPPMIRTASHFLVVTQSHFHFCRVSRTIYFSLFIHI